MTRRGGRLLGRAGGGRWLGLLLALTPPASAGGAEGEVGGQPAERVLSRGYELNLCTTMGFVGVGEFVSVAYQQVESDGLSELATVGQFRVTRVVYTATGIQTGDVIQVAVPGGVDENGRTQVLVDVHFPEVGEWWAFALVLHPSNEHPFPHIHGYYRATSALEKILPDESALQRAWGLLCRSRPEGVYFTDLLYEAIPDNVLAAALAGGPEVRVPREGAGE